MNKEIELDHGALRISLVRLVSAMAFFLGLLLIVIGVLGYYMSGLSHKELLNIHSNSMMPAINLQKLEQDLNFIGKELIKIEKNKKNIKFIQQLSATVANTGFKVELDEQSEALDNDNSPVFALKKQITSINEHVEKIIIPQDDLQKKVARQLLDYWRIIESKLTDYLNTPEASEIKILNIETNIEAMQTFLKTVNAIFTTNALTQLNSSKNFSQRSKFFIAIFLLIAIVAFVTITISTTIKTKALFKMFEKNEAEQKRLAEIVEKERQNNEQRINKEIEDTRILQEMLFPKSYMAFSTLEIAGSYFSASECGGDWWHYFEKDNKIFIWIGDATGHGLPATLITSAARSAVAIIERIIGISPSKAFDLLNTAILQTAKGKMQMTFFLGIFDKTTKELTYSNAGHLPPLLCCLDNPLNKPSTLIPLDKVRSPRLGESGRSQFTEHTIKLNINDAVLFYTDGVAELSKQKNEMKFLKDYCRIINREKDVAEIINELQEPLGAVFENSQLIDDATVVIAKVI